MINFSQMKKQLCSISIFCLAAYAQAADVEVSWDKAHVFIPGRTSRIAINEVALQKPHPVVIYLHGCSGIAPNHGGRWGEHMSSWGFVVILPDSMARPSRRSNCEQRSFSVGSFPQAHAYRQQEIQYAIEQLKKQPWADTSNVFLFGHSEGGVATAAYPGDFFKGLVISGWGCSGGIYAPQKIPALAIAFDEDPWIYGSWGGKCSNGLFGKRELTRIDIPGRGHDTVWVKEARDAVFAFLKRHTDSHQVALPEIKPLLVSPGEPDEELKALN